MQKGFELTRNYGRHQASAEAVVGRNAEDLKERSEKLKWLQIAGTELEPMQYIERKTEALKEGPQIQ